MQQLNRIGNGKEKEGENGEEREGGGVIFYASDCFEWSPSVQACPICNWLKTAARNRFKFASVEK